MHACIFDKMAKLHLCERLQSNATHVSPSRNQLAENRNRVSAHFCRSTSRVRKRTIARAAQIAHVFAICGRSGSPRKETILATSQGAFHKEGE